MKGPFVMAFFKIDFDSVKGIVYQNLSISKNSLTKKFSRKASNEKFVSIVYLKMSF